MRSLKILACALVVAGCAGQGQNQAPVYAPQSGTIQLKVTTQDTTVQSVTFQVDNQTFPPVTQPASDGSWGIPFDTTKVSNGIHTVLATGTTSSGATETLLNNSILIYNAAPQPQAPSGSTPPATGPSTPASTAPNTPASTPQPAAT